MLGWGRIDHGGGDQAEKPFWISYADLMTSLAVLFLVVMLASLVSLTRTVTDLQDTRSRAEVLAGKYKKLTAGKARREQDIAEFWRRLESRSKGLGVEIDAKKNVVNFGSKARFDTGSDDLSSGGQLLLRRFTPLLLAEAGSPLGKKVVDHVAVDGFADSRGSYLYNLNLSLSRSQRVLCSLLGSGGAELSGAEKRDVRDLFTVGGFSFNNARQSLAASRRVEIKLDFLEPGAKRKSPQRGSADFGTCALDA